ncbi:MAG: helix-turn-helix transcriptional regulator [Calditrichia bacterium]
MNSNLKFFDFKTNAESDCGNVLVIETSSKKLGWQGIILEKGESPHFFPQNVYTPYFYFALALEADLEWNASMGGRMQPLKTVPGDIWINPPRQPFTHDISEPCFFIILAVEEDVLLESANIIAKKNDLKFLNNYNVRDAGLKNMIELFYYEVESDGKGGIHHHQNLMSLLSNYYINNYSNAENLKNASLNTSKISQAEFDKLDRFIEGNLDQPIPIEKLAEILNYSKYYFLREFKKFSGHTPLQYILEKKMRRARELLSEPSNTIASVTFDLGFNDQSYFTNVFKSHFGITPGQYRKGL